MCIYYLYVKTHNKTGLKYLGYTGKKDPYKYKGSGDYWTKHINKHGYDVTTEILKECSTKQEIKEWGLYYSSLWNVVESRDKSGNKMWANLKPENGDGAGPGKYNHMHRPEIKERHANALADPINKEKQKLATKEAMNRPDVREKVVKARNNPEYIENMKRNLHTPEIFDSRKGSGNPKFDNKIYKFVHSTGIIEYSTRYDLMKKYNLDQGNLAHLISGRCHIIKGWKIER